MSRKLKITDDGSSELREAEKILDYALTNEEKELCTNVVVFGPGYLRQTKGWKSMAVKQFLGRAEVVREINALKSQYEDRGGIQERTQFFSQIRVNGMVPTSLNILARSLRGEVKGEDGKKVMPPTKMQFDAAVEVLNRANIQGGKWNGNDQTPQIDARSIQLALGGSMSDTDSLGAEGREKVRAIVNSVLNKSRALIDASDVVDGRRKAIEKKFGKVHVREDDDGTPSED